MLKKYFLNSKKAILAFVFLAITTHACAVQILHAGVKINSTPLTEEKYLLTRQELDDFLKAKTDLDAYREIVKLRNDREAEYAKTIASQLKAIEDLSKKVIDVSDTLVTSANDKAKLIKDNAVLRTKKNRSDLISSVLLLLKLADNNKGFEIKF